MKKTGPPPEIERPKDYMDGYLDGYGDRDPWPGTNPTDPNYIEGRKKGRADYIRTDRRLREAGLR